MSRWMRFGIAAAILTAIIGAGAYFGPSGMAYGVEFNPDRFVHRSFRYYVWCDIQVTPKETEEWRGKLDTYLNNEGYVTDSLQTSRWDFIKGFRPGWRGWSGMAKRLCQCSGCWSSTDGRWIEWSRRNPEAAKQLWPTFVQWVQARKYDQAANLLFLIDNDNAATPDDVDLAMKDVLQIP